MAWARTSFVRATDTSITLVVFLDQGRDVLDYSSIYIYLNGQQSSNLRGRHPNGQKHWSLEYTFYGLNPSSSYWADCSVSGSYGDGGYYSTTSPPKPPIPNMSQSSASGRRVTMQVWNTGNATSLDFYTSWDGYWDTGYSPSSQFYTFTTPQYGGHYEVWVRGQNSAGAGDVKKAYAYSQPNAPVISWDGTFSGNVVPIDVSISSYFDEIWVEMYTSTGTLYETKKLFWDGSYNRTGRVTFGALTAGATYTFKAKAIDNSGYTGNYSNNLNITYNPAPQTPLMRHHSSSGKTIYMVIDNYYTATTLSFKPSWQSSRDPDVPIGQSTYSFTAPEYGGIYTIAVRGKNSSGLASDDKISDVMAEPRMPSISAGQISQDSSGIGTVPINVSTEGYFDKITVEMWHDGFTSMVTSKDILWSGSTRLSTSLSFGGMAVNQRYVFRAKVVRNSGWGYNPDIGYGGNLYVTNTMTRPINWAWTTAQNANGHKISGATFSMLATEWNSFTARINAFRKYKGLSEYSFTTVSRGSQFLFNYFNEANIAIGAMRSTGVSNVTRGDKVYASYFNGLMNALNGIT